MEAALIIAIVELVLKYGPKIASEMIGTFSTEEISLDQINSLLVAPPEHYLKVREDEGNTN